MNAPFTNSLGTQQMLSQAIETACQAIAPTWPLDRMIAVNPYWEQINRPFENVGKDLIEVAASPISMPISYYREKWREGEIKANHLEMAMSESSLSLSRDELVDALNKEEQHLIPAPMLCDSLDKQRDLLHEPAWCDTITHQIAQFCAAYFDHGQADWHPNRGQTLYTSWRESLIDDHSVALLMKAPGIPNKAKLLAEDANTQIENALLQLGLEQSQWSKYLQAVIMRLSGWASWCAYLRWQARLEGGDDETLVDLLSIRLSWECLIDNGQRHQDSIWGLWQEAWDEHFQNFDKSSLKINLLWQRAHEISYQQRLCHKLTAVKKQEVTNPKVQAVFCIDVRSEVFRRHLEAQSPDIQTLGFAGFFGLPISYTPVGTEATRPQLPGLLAPALNVSETTGCATKDHELIKERKGALESLLGWRPFQSVPGSSFTLVETLGLGYAYKLFKRSLPGTAEVSSNDNLGLNKQQAKSLKPTLKTAMGGDINAQAKVAADVLGAMCLKEGLAPLVLLVGHGSQNQNNPHRAGLDCGACCGQTGEVNSRALANLLNDSAVREQLVKDGIKIPDETFFIAALHNTTTDEMKLFDTDELPQSKAAEFSDVTAWLKSAGFAARQERAPTLGLEELVGNPEKLTKAVKQRANDWAQTRPEWGLANNAAFIVGPRSRTRGVNLAGRSFLHEYDHEKDTDNSLLELIMTAPMVVTHWINMQYYSSTVDNKRFGSGNKTLHNVVGGRLGVFEGNGGDLRIGLSWQSLNDGEKWLHQPLRLTVIIDAPRADIESIIGKHEMVKDLLDNQWLYLARFEGDDIEFYRQGDWIEQES